MPIGRLDRILRILQELYPRATTALAYETPFQLLIATMLSAQCTDTRVNQITKKLFADHPTPQAMIELSPEELANYIRSAGLWKSKTAHILTTCRVLLVEHGGCVPASRTKLMELPGVGRKTANVVLANAFGVPALAVDTHVMRVANRLGLVASSHPEKVEVALMEVVPKEQWNACHHWLIYHGRTVCKARKPRCQACRLAPFCPAGAPPTKSEPTRK